MNASELKENLDKLQYRLQTRLLESLEDSFYDDTRDYLGLNLRQRPKNDLSRHNRLHVAVSDRTEGRHYPYYESMDDILLNLEACRNLHTFDSTSIGGLSALQSYTVGGEWSFSTAPVRNGIVPRKPTGEELRLTRYCDQIFEQFVYDNHWSETILPWIATQPRIDGDSTLAFYPSLSNGVKIEVDFIYPETLRPPQNPIALADYTGIDGRWEFGVHTRRHRHNGRWNYKDPLGFHVVHDEGGNHWEYLPSWPQPHMEDLRCGFMVKRNTHPHGARGVSDYYPVRQDIERVYKLATNLGEGSAIQAAIAMIIHRENTTGSANLTDATKDAIELYRTMNQTTGYQTHVRKFGTGTVIETDSGSSYESGPIANDAQGMFIEVGQWLSRRLGVRWNMPEYLITGDASNANYASTLVAQSPFVKYCEHEQALLKLAHYHIYWRILYIHWLYGSFTNFGLSSFQQLQTLARPEVTAPSVAIQEDQTDRLAVLNERGVLTRKRWAEMEQLPPEEVEDPVDDRVEDLLANV